MESILDKLSKIQRKYPLLVIAIIFTISLFFLYYSLQLQTDSSFDRMFAEDSNTMTLKRLVSSEFGSTDTLFVVFKIDNENNDPTATTDIREPSVLKAMQKFQKSIETETTVARTISLADVLLFEYGKLPETVEESKEMIEGLKSSTDSFLSKDFAVASVIIQADISQKPGSLQAIEDTVNEKIEEAEKPTGTMMILTGLPTLINRIMLLLINDNIKTIGIALLAVFIILFIYFRSAQMALVSVTPVVLVLIWLTGTMALANIYITMMVASIGAMMVGMGIDYSIHITHSFHERVREGKDDATEETVKHTGGALFASVATTMAGFLAMLFGSSPNSQIQGTVLAIGIAYAFILTMVLLPAMLSFQRKYLYSNLDEIVFKLKQRKSQQKKKGLQQRFLEGLGRFQVKRPGVVIILVLILTLLLIPGFGFVRMDTSNENWIPDDDPVIDSFGEVEDNFGGTDTQNFLVMFNEEYEHISGTKKIDDMRDPRVLHRIDVIGEMLVREEYVKSVSSPANTIKEMNNGRIPQDLEEIKTLVELNPNLKSQFNNDFSITQFRLEAFYYDEPEYYKVLDVVDSVKIPEEIKLVPQGGGAEDEELMNSLMGDTMLTALLGFLLVIITATLFYRSFTVGMLAFIPILISIFWTVGIMGYIDLPFTVLTSGMLAILMGMGIDFSIHLIHRTRELLAEGKTIDEALPETLTSTGEAIMVTTLTTIIGFMALAFATLLGTQRLGYTLAVGILATFISCMVLVPAVLSLQEKIRVKRTLGGR